MLLNEIPFQDVIPIQGYGQNNFKINNKYYEGGIFIFTNIICKWSDYNDFSFSKFDISDMDIMFIGMGVENKKVKPIRLSLLPNEIKQIESSKKRKNLFIQIILPLIFEK